MMSKLACLIAATLAFTFALALPAYAQENAPEPEGYRTDNYRAPVPATLAGARVLATGEAEAIWRAGAGVFIDVLPHAPKPQNLPAGTIWREKPRLNIPGSIWLPDTGYGTLAAATEDYLRHGLARASGGNSATLLVIYCLADCWMSWNAAKRALSYGYRNVAWYPEGTDGWQRADLPVAESPPQPRAGEESSSPR
jgi:PQQ-dependent catabolism-associated CXXCW motif protein